MPHLIRSVPTDPDRALFPENDDYETLVGRVIRRSGRGDELIETCLALLGDPQAKAADDLKQAVSTTFAAWAGTPAPDNRAAQILSLVCRDAQVRAADPRGLRALPREARGPDQPPAGQSELDSAAALGAVLPGPHAGQPAATRRRSTRCWPRSSPELNEARHGRPDPSEPNIHFLQLEYTPCWRATAAWALGRIGDRRAAPVPPLPVVGDLNNAIDVRHAAAEALLRLADPASLEAMKKLAQDYPEHSVRRVLLRTP